MRRSLSEAKTLPGALAAGMIVRHWHWGTVVMRQKNKRVIIVGAVLIALAIGFFLFFLSIAGKSNDPRALMSTVGTVSGVLIGIGTAMIVVGAIGKQV